MSGAILNRGAIWNGAGGVEESAAALAVLDAVFTDTASDGEALLEGAIRTAADDLGLLELACENESASRTDIGLAIGRVRTRLAVALWLERKQNPERYDSEDAGGAIGAERAPVEGEP
jgi:hypothetical protein